jgi:broad specificity phosphatase PhoE
MSSRLVLVRHLEICPSWQGRCYGASDVPLSEAGSAGLASAARQLAGHNPAMVVHSGLQRTRSLAAAVVEQAGCDIQEDPRWREMDFGSWEGRSWTEIFDDVGHAMSRLVSEPASYAPPGGETVHAVRDRVTDALLELPADRTILVICHGGPIGAILGTLAGCPARDWPRFVPAYGSSTELNPADRARLDEWRQSG